jgi:hypothetical protein
MIEPLLLYGKPAAPAEEARYTSRIPDSAAATAAAAAPPGRPAVKAIRSKTKTVQRLDKHLERLSTGLLVLALLAVSLSVAFLDDRFPDRSTTTTVAATISTIQLATTIATQAVLLLYYRCLLSTEARVNGISYLTPRELRKQAFVESLLNLIQTVPGWSESNSDNLDPQEILALLVFLRTYHVFRVIRNSSQIYQNRFTIKREFLKSGEPCPQFDWLLSVKAWLQSAGFSSFIVALTMATMITTYFLTIFERETEHTICKVDDWGQYSNVLWFSLVSSLLLVLRHNVIFLHARIP